MDGAGTSANGNNNNATNLEINDTATDLDKNGRLNVDGENESDYNSEALYADSDIDVGREADDDARVCCEADDDARAGREADHDAS